MAGIGRGAVMRTRFCMAVLVCILVDGRLAGAEPAIATDRISAFGKYLGYSPEQFPDQIQSSFYLPMRDGVRLAVDLYRPGSEGKPVEGRFPVVWHHTFDRRFAAAAAQSAANAAPQLTKFGYVVAVVERRGMGASFGERRGYNDRIEAEDAYEINEWLARQPWSNGHIGIVGCSNTGAAAMHAITIRPPHLLAAFVGCFAWDTYDWTLRGGIFAQWGTGVQRTLEEDLKSKPVDGDESKTLLLEAAQQHRKNTNLAAMWRGIPFRNDFSPLTASRFWSEGSIASYADEMRQSGVALYITGGWRDDLRKDGWVAFNNWTPGKRHIIIGPWTHCRNDGFDLFAEMHRFFDFYLKGIDNGLANDAPVHFFTVNAPKGREWQSAQAWPPSGTQRTLLYLGDKSRLSSAPGGRATAFQVRYDVGCAAGFDKALQSGPYAQPCPVDQAAAHFLSAPMQWDTEVTGHPIADLWISADASDVNVFVYLEDVAPDGTVWAISDGRQRASLRRIVAPPYDDLGLPWRRSNREDLQPLVPGTPVRMQMDLFPVSYIFKTGHRIRVSVTGADYRERDREPQDPAPHLTIYNSSANPSSITLPIMTAAHANASCDADCLQALTEQYLAALSAHTPESLKKVKTVRFTENGTPGALGDGLWRTASSIGDGHFFVDASSQQAMFIGIINEGESPAIVSLRLGFKDRQLAQVEHIVARKGAHPLFAPADFILPGAMLSTQVPPADRLSREDLIAIANSYFDGLQQHSSAIIKAAENCQRIENGVQTTGRPGRGSRNCQQSADVLTYIKSVDDRRFSIVDVDHGIVAATVTFDIPGDPGNAREPRTLLLTEWFKIEQGMIQHIEAVMTNLPHGATSGWNGTYSNTMRGK